MNKKLILLIMVILMVSSIIVGIIIYNYSYNQLLLEGRKLNVQENYEEEFKVYEKGIKLFPFRSELYILAINTGKIIGTHNLNYSTKNLELSYMLFPSSEKLINLLTIYNAKKEYSKIIKVTEKNERFINNQNFLDIIIVSSLKLNNNDLTLKYLNKLTKLHNLSPESYMIAGYAYYYLEDFNNSLKNYLNIIKMNATINYNYVRNLLYISRNLLNKEYQKESILFLNRARKHLNSLDKNNKYFFNLSNEIKNISISYINKKNNSEYEKFINVLIEPEYYEYYCIIINETINISKDKNIYEELYQGC